MISPTEAHDIVNPEINVILKGCGKSLNFSINVISDFICEEGDLCPSCEGKLKGIISAQEREIEFLENDISDAKFIFNSFKRLQALKISREDLRERVK